MPVWASCAAIAASTARGECAQRRVLHDELVLDVTHTESVRAAAPGHLRSGVGGRVRSHMLGQFPCARAAGAVAVPEGAVVDELPSEVVAELEPESVDVVLEEEPEVSLVCA